MNTRVVYQIMRADFLERVRGYKFLIILGLMVVVTYAFVPVLGANYITIDFDGYRGVYNSAWIGASVALLVAGYLGLLSFFIVKGSQTRDRKTGVGQIIATTSIGKTTYMLGKWLSNLAVLVVVTVVIIISAIALQLIRGEVQTIDIWLMVAPFLIIVLPTMSFVAALALVFETIPILRGGLGNVVFFFFWANIGFPLALGGSFIVQNMQSGALAAAPGYQGGSSCCLILESNAVNLLGRELGVQKTFVWEGMEWTSTNLGLHAALLAVAIILVLVAALFFDRFASTGSSPGRISSLLAKAGSKFSMSWARRDRSRNVSKDTPNATEIETSSRLHLTPLNAAPLRLRFGRMLLAELRLALKGLGWVWYLVAGGLVVVGVMLPLQDAQRWVLPVSWLWPILIWSGMGVREAENHTDQLVFSAPHPVRRQLPVIWLSGFILAMLAGSGVFARMLLDADADAVLSFVVAAAFIPSLALALGALTGSSKSFQVTYMVLWYAGPMQGIQAFDFMELDSTNAVANDMPLVFTAATCCLLVAAVVGRIRQIRT